MKGLEFKENTAIFPLVQGLMKSLEFSEYSFVRSDLGSVIKCQVLSSSTTLFSDHNFGSSAFPWKLCPAQREATWVVFWKTTSLVFLVLLKVSKVGPWVSFPVSTVEELGTWLPWETCCCPIKTNFSCTHSYLPAVKCDAIPQPRSGSVNCTHSSTGEFTYKSSCAVSCEEGFELRGSAQLECTSQGQWTQEVPSCQGRTEFNL